MSVVPEAAPPPDPLEPDRDSPARYALEGELARGGMGVIFLAHDRVAQRDVVYKRLLVSRPEQRALRVALFRREYEALARLPHPNIVDVYDYGEEKGTPYYVMERLGGADLASAAPLPFREACRVLRDVASALSLVHSRRLVHRDVSPNNVRLTADGTAKLLDFGALTGFGRTDELVGTPGFMAPESFARAPLDQRSDLYALGALAYWTLTRRTPYPARSLDMRPEAFAEPPPPPSVHVPEIPRELDELVLALLAVDAEARPHDASYVIDRLTSLAELAPEADERRVAQSYLAHPPLCGRDDVLHTLHAIVDRARTGLGGAVLIEGEAGLGRSALLAVAAQHAQLQGATVLHVRGDGSGEPFGAARSLVETITLLYPDLALSPASPLALAQPHEPSVADLAEAAERRVMLLLAIERVLFETSTRNPLVLVVDDLHLVDDPSLALLTSLALAIDERNIAIVASSLREHGSRHLKLASSAARVALAPLGQVAVGELVHAIFGDVPNALKLAHWLHAQAGGNPATTLDLLRLLMQHDVVRYTLGTFHLPSDLTDALAAGALGNVVLARFGDLPAEVHHVALVLGLHEGALTSEAMSTATGLALHRVQRAIDELVQRGAVAQVEHGFQLLGSSLRKALAQSVPDETRRSVHDALARTLLDRAHAESDVRLRYDASEHFLEAGRDDDALALLIGHPNRLLTREEAIWRAALLERALERARLQRRSKEQCLWLLIPLAGAGFHTSSQRYAEPLALAVSTMADVCGMSLARRLRRYVGGVLAVLTGLIYAALRVGLTPKRDRIGSLSHMLTVFVGIVCDATALAATRAETAEAGHYVEQLAPFSALPKHSPGWIMRQFAIATAEVSSGHVDRASARYAALMPLLPNVKRLDAAQRRILYLGVVNGRGQCEASMGRAEALPLADDIATDPFFAPFAEGIRFSYHALRGEREIAEAYRRRAELLALHGGIAWSAESTLAIFAAYAATLTEDAIALVRAVADLERLAEAAPKLRTYARICEAWLTYVRGRPDRALPLFEEVIDSQAAAGLAMTLVNRSLYVRVLDALGMHARAEQVCLRALADPSRESEQTIGIRALKRELAVAMAAQGRMHEAVALAEQQLADALPLDNPLELGATHRDRARIALLARDRATFDAHLAQMEHYYQQTRNPCLRRHGELLVASAEQRGLRAVRPPPTRPPARKSEDEELESETFVEAAGDDS